MSTASLRVVGHECHTPLQIKKFYISTDGTHTYTHTYAHTHTRPAAAGQMMKGKWKWDDNDIEIQGLAVGFPMKMRWQLLTGTRGGERKRRTKKEKAPTKTHLALAQSGQTLKRQGKRKSGRTRGQTPTRGGGGGQKRLTQPTRREPNLPRHAKDPNLT